MKKYNLLLAALLVNCFCSYSQLLSNPSLYVEDVESALSNPDHLMKILSDNGFVFETGKTGKQNQPGSIINPLVPDRESNKTVYWRTCLNNKTFSEGSPMVRSVSLYEWKSNRGPYPAVIRTISLWINADPVYADKVESFFRRIKDRYPINMQRYIGNTDLQRAYSEPLDVFVNNTSKIEIQMNQAKIGGSKGDVSDYYIVSFNLVR